MALPEGNRNHPEPEIKGLGFRGLKWYLGILAIVCTGIAGAGTVLTAAGVAHDFLGAEVALGGAVISAITAGISAAKFH